MACAAPLASAPSPLVCRLPRSSVPCIHLATHRHKVEPPEPPPGSWPRPVLPLPALPRTRLRRQLPLSLSCAALLCCRTGPSWVVRCCLLLLHCLCCCCCLRRPCCSFNPRCLWSPITVALGPLPSGRCCAACCSCILLQHALDGASHILNALLLHRRKQMVRNKSIQRGGGEGHFTRAPCANKHPVTAAGSRAQSNARHGVHRSLCPCLTWAGKR